MLKPKTLIMLIDFEGRPIMGDEMTNELRYSYLKGLLFNGVDDPIYDLLIVSDQTDKHTKMNELKKMSDLEGKHQWLNIDPDDGTGVEDIINMVSMFGYEIQNVVVGGCNTVGCIFNSTPYSSCAWAKSGIPVQIFLPMCADYQMSGLNQIEQNMMAFSDLYNAIKKNDVVNEVDPISRLSAIWLDPELKYETIRGIGE